MGRVFAGADEWKFGTKREKRATRSGPTAVPEGRINGNTSSETKYRLQIPCMVQALEYRRPFGITWD